MSELLTETPAVQPPGTPAQVGPQIAVECRCTDYGNALRLAYHFRNRVFYHPDTKSWFIWNGKHWKMDNNNQITSMAVEAIRMIRTVELPLLRSSEKEYKTLYSWMGWSLNKSKLNCMVSLAQMLLPPLTPLDTNKYLLNVQNGTIDLKTGVHLPHNRNHYITRLAPVGYDSYAECPKWLAYIHRAFKGDEVVISYFQKMLGYVLTGDTTEKCFFIFWGPDGNNGKTMAINVVRGLLGSDYCVQIASESLMSKKSPHIRSDIARLRGYRFASASETDKQYTFNEALVKVMTGGDAITARKLYQNEIEFTPEFKLFIATNPKPAFDVTDKAMMDRVVIIPFLVPIPRQEMNKNLTRELIEEEGAGILTWAVKGAVAWSAEGLGFLPECDDVRFAPIVPVDMNDFISKCCVTGNGLQVTSCELFTRYLEYHLDTTPVQAPLAETAFYAEITSKGFPSVHSRYGNCRSGIALKPE